MGDITDFEEEQAKTIDIRGEECPNTFVKAKWHIEQLQPGEILKVLIDHEPARKKLPKNMENHGQEVLDTTRRNQGEWVITIRRTEQTPPSRWIQVH